MKKTIAIILALVSLGGCQQKPTEKPTHHLHTRHAVLGEVEHDPATDTDWYLAADCQGDVWYVCPRSDLSLDMSVNIIIDDDGHPDDITRGTLVGCEPAGADYVPYVRMYDRLPCAGDS